MSRLVAQVLLGVFLLGVLATPWAGACEAGTRLPHPRSCKKYVECVNQTHYEERTCAFYERYDAAKKSCDYFWRATCKTSNCFEGRKDPVPQDCRRFYQCLNDEILLYSCPEGQMYDPVDSVCSATYNCSTTPTCVEDYRVPLRMDPDCKTYLECRSGKMTAQSCGWLQVFDPLKDSCQYWGQCKPLKAPCIGDWDKKADPRNCQRYEQCVNGTVQYNKCSILHRFDPVKLECNWIWSVKCLH